MNSSTILTSPSSMRYSTSRVVELLGLERDLEVVDEVDGGVVVEVLDAEDLLDPGDALLGGR